MTMRKLKLLSFVMIFMASILTFSSCSDNDDDGVQITKDMVVGTWIVTQATENGETINITEGMIKIVLRSNDSYSVRFYSDTYVGTYEIKGSTIIGTTLDPITEYFQFKSLSPNGRNATINYSNSIGDKYIFKASKTI